MVETVESVVARVEPFGAQQLSARPFFYNDFDIPQSVAKTLRQTIETSDHFFRICGESMKVSLHQVSHSARRQHEHSDQLRGLSVIASLCLPNNWHAQMAPGRRQS